MPTLIHHVLHLLFALFCLSVAAYVLHRAAGWLFEDQRQRATFTAAVLGAFVVGCAVNPSLGVASRIAGLLPGRPAFLGMQPAADTGSPCRGLRADRSAPPNGHIDDATIADAGTTSKLEHGAAVAAHDRIDLRGWISASGRMQPAAGICLVIDATPTGDGKIQYGISRPDVAAALGAPALDASGFDVSFDVSSLTPGRHRLQLGAFDAAHRSVALLSDAYPIDVQAK